MVEGGRGQTVSTGGNLGAQGGCCLLLLTRARRTLGSWWEAPADIPFTLGP